MRNGELICLMYFLQQWVACIPVERNFTWLLDVCVTNVSWSDYVLDSITDFMWGDGLWIDHWTSLKIK